jgi:hypothetical protein
VKIGLHILGLVKKEKRAVLTLPSLQELTSKNEIIKTD